MASWKDYSRIVAEAKASKKLDPVGQEDDDVDNDGDSDSSDSYLKKRRESVGAAIAADKKKKSMIKVEVPEKKLGYKVADIGSDGKEQNVKTYGAYKEALDPVGQEDDDIDNDGKKNTKSDKYLSNRRKVRSKVIEGASTKVDMDGPKVGCNDPDPRSMKTQANLVKTKLRMMGLRPLVMSNEPEGEQIDEIAPLVAGGIALGAAALGGSAIKRAQDAAKSGVNAANKGQSVKPGIGIGNAAHGIQKRNNALNDAMKQLRQSYQPEGELVDEGKEELKQRNKNEMQRKAGNLGREVVSTPKTKKYASKREAAMDRMSKLVTVIARDDEDKRFKNMPTRESFVGEDKEYRREMSKAAARERAEERREKGSRSAKSPGREGPSAGKSYADYQEISIKAHDKLTKKNKNVTGLVTNEEKGMSSDKMSGILKGHKYSKLQLLDMSKKSTKEGRHGEAAAFYKEFDRDDKKEEFSLVDRMIVEFSPLNEAPENTISGGKRRKGLSKTIQNKEVDNAAESGDYERADKLQDSSTIKVKKKSKSVTAPEEKPTSPTQATKKSSAGKTTAYERATRTSAAGRIRAARIARQTEREKREYKEKVRQETKAENTAEKEERLKASAERQQKLEAKDKETRVKRAGTAAEQEFDKKQAKKKALMNDIKQATQVKSPPVVSSRESAGKAIGSVTSSALEVGAVPFKLLGVGIKHALNKRKEKQRTEAGNKAREKALKDASKGTSKEVKESFSNWREDFILEVDNQDVNPGKKKIIDVSKVKNTIEINPNITEALPLLALAGKLVGGKVATGIAAKGATVAAKGGLQKKAVEFAAKKGGEMASSAIENSATSVQTPGQSDDIKNKVSSGAEGLVSFLMPKLKEDAAWTRKEGKNKSGGLNEKGRKSYESDNPGSDLKAPSKTVGNPRRKSFCARMSGMKAKLTSAKTARDPDSRINKSLRAWNC
jgi:hypothetical protein